VEAAVEAAVVRVAAVRAAGAVDALAAVAVRVVVVAAAETASTTSLQYRKASLERRLSRIHRYARAASACVLAAMDRPAGHNVFPPAQLALTG
jgi:hypothetical protein